MQKNTLIILYLCLGLLLVCNCSDRHHINPLDPYYSEPVDIIVFGILDSAGFKYQMCTKQWVMGAELCMYMPALSNEYWLHYKGININTKFNIVTVFMCYPQHDVPKSLWFRRKGINEP